MDRDLLVGSWRLAPDDAGSRRRYGEHALELTAHGDLVQSTVADGGFARVLLTWRLEGDTLVTDQPSASKIERSKLTLLDDGQLLMGEGPGASRYVRDEPDLALDPEAQLYALAGTALRHGVASAGAGAFTPFLMTQTATQMELIRIVDDSPEQAERAARSQAGQLLAGVTLCAWTYDGLATVEGESTNAVFARVSVRGRRTSKTLALRYRLKPDGTGDSFGGFLLAGEAEGWLP